MVPGNVVAHVVLGTIGLGLGLPLGLGIARRGRGTKGAAKGHGRLMWIVFGGLLLSIAPVLRVKTGTGLGFHTITGFGYLLAWLVLGITGKRLFETTTGLGDSDAATHIHIFCGYATAAVGSLILVLSGVAELFGLCTLPDPCTLPFIESCLFLLSAAWYQGLWWYTNDGISSASVVDSYWYLSCESIYLACAAGLGVLVTLRLDWPPGRPGATGYALIYCLILVVVSLAVIWYIQWKRDGNGTGKINPGVYRGGHVVVGYLGIALFYLIFKNPPSPYGQFFAYLSGALVILACVARLALWLRLLAGLFFHLAVYTAAAHPGFEDLWEMWDIAEHRSIPGVLLISTLITWALLGFGYAWLYCFRPRGARSPP